MNEKVLYGVIAALLIACLGQAYYIHSRRPGERAIAAGDWPARAEKLREDARQKVRKGESLPPVFFDDFFNDEFFRRRFDPFAEMERMHRQMAAMFGEAEKLRFDDSWDNWFAERLGTDGFGTKVSRTDKNVVLTMDIPGMKDGTAEVNVTNDRIRISFTARKVRDRKEGGASAHSESSQSYVKILPVPADAVPGTAKTSIDKDRVTVTFDRNTEKGK